MKIINVAILCQLEVKFFSQKRQTRVAGAQRSDKGLTNGTFLL
jgi:hypothetical protein